MSDTVSILNAKREKADAKASRYRKMLKTAEKEVADLDTALRILGEIEDESGDSPSNVKAAPTVNRQLEIVDLLGVGQEQARSPINLFEQYRRDGEDDITIDTFRTTIWRMKDKVYEVANQEWVICSADGNYWKNVTARSVFVPPPMPKETNYEPPSSFSTSGYDDLEDPPF